MKKIVILIGILVSELVFGMAGKAAEPISSVSVVTMQAVSKVIIEEKLGQNATNWNEIGADEGEAYFLDDGEKFYPGSRFIDDDRCFAVNSQGDIYLFDIVNNRIKKYDSEGKYLKSISVKSWIGPVKYQPADKNYPAYTFVNPIEYVGRNITIDEDDNIYVYSWKNMQTNKNYKPSSSIISKYSPDDKLIRTWETNVMGEFKVDKSYLEKKAYYYIVAKCKIRLDSTTNGTNKYIITMPNGTEKTLLSTINLRTNFCGITRDGYYRIFGGKMGRYYWGFYFDKNLELKKVVNSEYPYGEPGNDENLYLLDIIGPLGSLKIRIIRWKLEVINGK